MSKAMEAAKLFCNYLRKIGFSDAEVWDREKIQRNGWGERGSVTAAAAVCLEGGPRLAEMQVFERGWFKDGMQPVANVYCEPYSEWLVYFYDEKGR